MPNHRHDIPRTPVVVRRGAMVVLAMAAAWGGAGPAGGRDDMNSDAPFDVVIANGRVVDGTGSAWFYGDVGIRGDRIARVVRRGAATPLRGVRTIDATGMVVTPGFIDIQAGGNYVSGDGRDVSKVTQ